MNSIHYINLIKINPQHLLPYNAATQITWIIINNVNIYPCFCTVHRFYHIFFIYIPTILRLNPRLTKTRLKIMGWATILVHRKQVWRHTTNMFQSTIVYWKPQKLFYFNSKSMKKHTSMKSYKRMHNSQSFFLWDVEKLWYLHIIFTLYLQMPPSGHFASSYLFGLPAVKKNNNSNKYTFIYTQFYCNLPLPVFVFLVLLSAGVLLPLCPNLNFEILGIYYLPLGKIVTPQP